MSSKSLNLLIAVVTVGLLVLGVLWWAASSNDQVAERFARRLSRGEYAEAARLVAAPGSLTLNGMGQLEIVDQAGARYVILGTKLPFVVSGAQELGGPIGHVHAASGAPMISVTALGQSVNGTLTSPAVTMWLHAEDGEVIIDAVEGVAPNGTSDVK